MKIAIASSGLGHISRGIETWARDTALALHERGVEVTLFAAGKVEGIGVSEYRSVGAKADTTPSPRYPVTPTPRNPDTPLPLVVLPCLRRNARPTRWLARLMPGFCWRWGLKRAYDLEQQSFWLHLQRHLRRERYDLLHVQDPLLAELCRRARGRSRLSTKEILAHGTEEPAAFLARFEYLQHLAPWHMESALRELQATENDYPHWFVSPNFVDTEKFHPDQSLGTAFRREHEIPLDAFVVGCAAAIKHSHKRLDYLIREFVAATKDNHLICGRQPYLLLAGAWEKQSADIEALANQVGSDRVKVLFNLSTAQMPAFYNAINLFVLPSLFEMLGIVFLEAMACQTPCVAHVHPVLNWVLGKGGQNLDLSVAGNLARFLLSINENWVIEKANCARTQVQECFSKEAVIAQYIDYYHNIHAKHEESVHSGFTNNL